MPELPEAEYMVRRLQQYARRAHIVEGPAVGRVRRYWRRAKSVLIDLDSGVTLRVRLGMTGHIYWIPRGAAEPRFTRAVLRLSNGGAIVFEDARRFGGIDILSPGDLDALGPEPLDPAFTWHALKQNGAKLSQPVKAFLMDQARVAGLGNIWAAESLFAARIHPSRPARSLSDAEWRRLHGAIRRVLTRAIAAAFEVTDGPADFPEADLQRVKVYGRSGQRCFRCRAPIARIELSGRGTYFCPECQK